MEAAGCAKRTTAVEHSQHRKRKPLHYSKMANPAKNPATIRPKLYTWPISIMGIRPGAAPPLGFPCFAEPSPKPVNTTPLAAEVLLAVALIVEMVELLGGRGLWAPQGLFSRHSNWHLESPTQFATQTLLISLHMK